MNLLLELIISFGRGLLIYITVTTVLSFFILGKCKIYYKKSLFDGTKENDFKLFNVDDSLLSITRTICEGEFDPTTFISKSLTWVPLFKYYIYKKGLVLRWSPLHFDIDKMYKYYNKKLKDEKKII